MQFLKMNKLVNFGVCEGIACVLVALTVCAMLTEGAYQPEEPVKLVVRTTDKERVSGLITYLDSDGFDLSDAHGKSQRMDWDRFSNRMVFAIHQRVLGKQNAEHWFDLGKLLLDRAEGRPLAEKAFDRAVHSDESFKPLVDEALAEHESLLQEYTEQGAITSESEQIVETNTWPALSEQQMQQAVEEGKQFARETAFEVNSKMRLYETDYYLFFTDLSGRDAMKWARMLDSMYHRLCRMFAIPRGENIYRGKALVFVFTKRDHFIDFERLAFNYSPGYWTAGVCHQRSNGDVMISFYRQPNKRDFTAVLIHESAHGFLHRYRSPRRVTTWANEGLAEWISHQFGPRSPQEVRKQTSAVKLMRKYKTIGGGFFTSNSISATQYGIAANITDYMIKSNAPGYAAFINGIKDGLPWRQSLEENFGMDIDRLVGAYGRSVGIKSLKH